METSFAKPKSQIKNILIRYNSPFKTSGQEEISHILKYSPKYYKSLSLEKTPNRSLLGKVKKIKRLKKLTAVFADKLPQKFWFNLFANTRKEIEEFPELNHFFTTDPFLSERLILQKAKFFPNVKRMLFGKGKFYYYARSARNDSLPIKKLFVKYLWGFRPKNLEIILQERNWNQMEWIIERLNKMDGLLRGLETFRMKIENVDLNIEKLFQNQNVFSHLTDLSLSERFDPNFVEISKICKNLKFLSLNLWTASDQRPEFLRLLASIQNLSQLESLDLGWPIHIRHFWSHFQPQASLKNLKVRFDLRNKGLLGESLKDLEEYWSERKELDGLEFDIKSSDADDMNFVRFFITAMLKKICKLHSFNPLSAERINIATSVIEFYTCHYEKIKLINHEINF